jgi:hypothetical protein
MPAEEPAPAPPEMPEPAEAPAPEPAEPPAPAEAPEPAAAPGALPEVPPPTDLAPPSDDPFSMNDDGYRTWSDDSGRYQIVARYVTTLEDGVIRLQKPNGRYVRVDFRRLSLIDQGYVSSQTEALAMN